MILGFKLSCACFDPSSFFFFCDFCIVTCMSMKIEFYSVYLKEKIISSDPLVCMSSLEVSFGLEEYFK